MRKKSAWIRYYFNIDPDLLSELEFEMRYSEIKYCCENSGEWDKQPKQGQQKQEALNKRDNLKMLSGVANSPVMRNRKKR